MNQPCTTATKAHAAGIVQLGHRGRVGWTICAMLFAATSINYMDWQVVGLLKLTLQNDIGLTEVNYGYIVAAFQVAYAAGLVIAGRVVDRLGSRIGYSLFMGVWSLAAMAHALPRSAAGFGVARFLLGLGESGNFPAAIKTVAGLVPASRVEAESHSTLHRKITAIRCLNPLVPYRQQLGQRSGPSVRRNELAPEREVQADDR